MRTICIVLVGVLVVILCVIGYFIEKFSLFHKKDIQTIVFPIAAIEMLYVEDMVKNNDLKLTHYVPALKTGEMTRNLIEINSTNQESKCLLAAFVVDGYLPERKKLNTIYVSPRLTTNELKGLISASNRR